MLIRAAAGHWKVTAEQCRADKGSVVGPQGQRLSYGALAGAAAKLPLAASPPLKQRSDFALIGKPLPRLDTVAKCTGTAVFGIDVVVPGMLYGAIQSAPSFTGALTAIRNEAEILKLPGVHAIVRLPAVHVANEEPGSQHPGTAQSPRHNAVCVVADRFWQAKRAADALDLVFDPGAGGDLSTAKIDGLLQAAMMAHKAVTAVETGRPREILQERAESIIERRFTVPHVTHAPLEPVNATASWKDGAVEVWGPIQAVAACQDAIVTSLGIKAEAIKLNVTFLGGSFGRKIVPDYVVQAVHASKAVGRPVKLIRTREQDLRHGIFRVNAGGRFRAVLDQRGYPLAVQARVVGQSLFGATRKSWLDQTPEGAWDESMVDGIYNQDYRLPNFLVETVDTPLPVPVYFMRSVGSTAAVFFWESFISELAQRAGIDQYVYRRDLLADNSLALRVLDAVAERAQWKSAPTSGVVRGISYNCYVGRGGRFRTYVAQVVELAPVGDRLAVKRVFCAVVMAKPMPPWICAVRVLGLTVSPGSTAQNTRFTARRSPTGASSTTCAT